MILSLTELEVIERLTKNLDNLLKLVNQPDYQNLLKFLHENNKMQFLPLNEKDVRFINKSDITKTIEFGQLILESHGRTYNPCQ